MNPAEQKELQEEAKAKTEASPSVKPKNLSQAPQTSNHTREPEIPVRRSTVQAENKIVIPPKKLS